MTTLKNQNEATTIPKANQIEWLGELLYSFTNLSSGLQFIVENSFMGVLPQQLNGLPNLLEVLSTNLESTVMDLASVHMNLSRTT